jgi:hypothetical protein
VESCTVDINDCYTNRNKAGQEQSIEIGLASMENELKKTDMTLMSLPRNTSWCGRGGCPPKKGMRRSVG